MSLPERIGRRVFETLGRMAHRRLAGVRATVAANQARVLGADPTDEHVEHATREAFELYARGSGSTRSGSGRCRSRSSTSVS